MSKVLDAIRKREVAKFRPAPVVKAKKSTKKAEPVIEPEATFTADLTTADG